ncbi:MAG: DNA polymerase III subunit delta' [Gammaproteobacteria bacterium]
MEGISNRDSALYPWQEKLWQQLSNNSIKNRIAHALLLSGSKGVGKYQFALAFKNSLLCSENSSGQAACGECRFCKMQNHPDFYEVTLEVDDKTEKQSNVIKINQIRNLIEFCSLHTHFGEAKVIIIHPAEAMNKNASNALLKILEEPPQNTYFILISNEKHHLSATIKSRCQLVNFKTPEIADSRKWLQSQSISEDVANSCLKFAYNAPLTAKFLAESEYINQHSELINNLLAIANKAEDPVVIANSWLKIDPNVPLQALYSCLSDLILLKNVQNCSDIINSSQLDRFQQIANNVSYAGLYVILDKIALAKHQIQANIAILGIYEDILNLWQRLTIKIIQQR